jgi:probable FeS assembly SUF system protein SufT
MFDSHEVITLNRDCRAIVIPDGKTVLLQKGEGVQITQSVGGHFTVHSQGRLYRINSNDADAIDQEAQKIDADIMDRYKDDEPSLAIALLKTCYDPEITVNIYDLGLIYGINFLPEEKNNRKTNLLHIVMTLTSPGCGMGPILIQDVQEKCNLIPSVHEVNVELVFDPPWQQHMMSDEAKLHLGLIY